jgi:hypothetical protein
MVLPVDLFIVGRLLIEAENTSALPGLYTRFLKCFVSAAATTESGSLRGANGSVESRTTTQNAGCTMGIHADCTKAQNQGKYKLLILKGF